MSEAEAVWGVPPWILKLYVAINVLVQKYFSHSLGVGKMKFHQCWSPIWKRSFRRSLLKVVCIMHITLNGIFVTAHTNLSTSVVTQRQSVSFSAPLSLLKYYLHQLSDDVVSMMMGNGREGLRIFSAISIVKEPSMLVIEVLDCASSCKTICEDRSENNAKTNDLNENVLLLCSIE